MNALSIAALLSLALLSDYVIEFAAELSTETVLDDEAGAIAELIPGPGLEIVDTLPFAAVSRVR
ncbi:MAG: hypothetical protein KJ904_06965 [Alphaproteobacteria bacterium]|nr:hypothetical protein [Alphaproteobacteria bacterium]MBU0797343.1 hypothetical protein [Alphaproteobacteria bacterium]MBU0886889.1 hypothetical protein [Alphaproteobacteria bacterium]MBU1812368.1 hypothetical protein [Alphaproteobacteria bacterium]MBU2090691.1 hypothetical protein [Alphaproteobacteria bacterium]